MQGFSIIIFQRSHSDSLQFNWNDFQSFVKQPMDFQFIVVEYNLSERHVFQRSLPKLTE